MYVEHNGILAIPASVIMEATGISINTYASHCRRGKLEVVKRGGYKSPALVKVQTLPDDIKKSVTMLIGSPQEAPKHKAFVDEIPFLKEAAEYFTNHPLVGNPNYDKKLRSYIANANIMWLVDKKFVANLNARAKNGKRQVGFWELMADAVKSAYCENKRPHSLPKNPRRLQDAYKLWLDEGFESFIPASFGNKFALKVDEKIELLLLSAYTMKNKPFGATVHSMVSAFFAGMQDIVNPQTGELLNRADFTKNGQPITISDTTVWNWLNKHDNRAAVDKKRMGAHRFNTVHRPHANRKTPQFSLSKLSLDDRELPRPYVGADGRSTRVVQYLAYDVHSGAIVGFAHSRKKDNSLFEDTLRNLFGTLQANNLPMPLEVEVENHLVNQYFDRLRNLFEHVTICKPGNSQQKRAEHFNRILKYTVERRQQGPQVGRHYGKHEAYQYDRDLVDNQFTEKTYSYEQLVADAIHAINTYNNTPHPNHPGLTRWDVLMLHVNDNCPAINWQLVAKNIGESTTTSIQRNYRLQVQHAQYELPAPELLRKLKPNDNSVTAYYLRQADGTIPEVFVYQGDAFIGLCAKRELYQEALAERTRTDWQILGRQQAATRRFDSMVKAKVEKLQPLEELKAETIKAIEKATPVATTQAAPAVDDIEALLAEAEANKEQYKQEAINKL